MIFKTKLDRKLMMKWCQIAEILVTIFLESASGYSVYCIRTYRQTARGYEFDELVARLGEPVVFGHN
jgi:hypothetical protein